MPQARPSNQPRRTRKCHRKLEHAPHLFAKRIIEDGEAKSMTLIAGVNDIYGGCCLFGDLMVTTRAISAPSTQYPTKPVRFSGGNQSPINSSVIRLSQKIAPFTDDIIAGFAGGERNIVRLSRYIKEIIGIRSIDFEELEKALIEYLRLHGKARIPQMVLFYAYPGTSDVHYFRINSSITNIEGVGDLYTAGSGQDDLVDFMSTRAKKRFGTIVANFDTSNGDSVPLVSPTVMLEFMEEVMFYQRETGWGLKNEWGGGCELYYRQPGGFIRVDNILFQSFVCRNSGSGLEFQERSKTLQQYSDNDELIIKTSHVAVPPEIHIVPSLRRFGMPFYKQDYRDHWFDQPIFTMTNIRNVDTGERWRFAQHNANGDRNARLGDPRAPDWVSYNTDFLATYISENS